ncbi:hypothetical protein [Mycobacterium rhizamassiliense]|uniref:hypothetical protein n=1 Tax=Mycobacterium rhizamassiliense TaxID=1841860 RepID=UPI0012FFA869|nr:hypothetical protein [Mycobacterium rhizamassiliense]
MTESELIDLGLTDDERLLISHGLSEYGGPIRGQVVMTRALGLSDSGAFNDLVARLRGAIFRKQPLSKLDWARAVFLTEVSWASDLVGSGLDFKTNFHDDEAAPLLRSIQWKLNRLEIGGSLLFTEHVDEHG